MIRSLTLTGAAVLTAALLTGCSEQQAPTVATDSPSPSLVDRGTTTLGFQFGDAERSVFIGLAFEDLISIFCTGADFDVDEVDELVVNRPDESMKVLLRGEVNVVVVEASPREGGVNCDDLLAAPHLTGIGRVVLTDSDFDFSGHGAAASQIHVVGTVTDESGERWHLVAFTHQVVDPSNTSFENRVTIKLTPIGG